MFKILKKEVRQIFCFRRIWWYKVKTESIHKRRSDRILSILAAVQPGGAHHQGPRHAHEDPGAGDEHSITNAVRFMVLEDLRYKSYVIRRGQSCWRQARGRRTGSRRTSRRRGTRRSGLPAHLTTAFWTILCVGSQSYSSMQSLTTKQGIWFRRWRCWWALLTGPSWRRPTRGSGPGSMLLLPLRAISMNTFILNMSLC
jgi:hypothetical protein